jgi:hypothetical protein
MGIKVLIKTQNILAQRPLGTMYYTIMSFMIDILNWLGDGVMERGMGGHEAFVTGLINLLALYRKMKV